MKKPDTANEAFIQEAKQLFADYATQDGFKDKTLAELEEIKIKADLKTSPMMNAYINDAKKLDDSNERSHDLRGIAGLLLVTIGFAIFVWSAGALILGAIGVAAAGAFSFYKANEKSFTGNAEAAKESVDSLHQGICAKIAAKDQVIRALCSVNQKSFDDVLQKFSLKYAFSEADKKEIVDVFKSQENAVKLGLKNSHL
ncbi:MAG: hypothetical protein K8R48_06445 [Alphaproteobacteria bacterium]|nr:hypothetical protein [Alphaproteobacteria bacterium]